MIITLIIRLIYCSFIITSVLHSAIKDYFSEEFDEGKNCENKEKLKKILNNHKDRCISYTEEAGTSSERWLQTCASHLAKKLLLECGYELVEHSNNLTYCNTLGVSTCCVTSYSCAPHTTEKWISRGKQYLNDANKYLEEHLVKGLGYKSCHHLKDYDASSCANDCRKYSETKFAKKCMDHNGLFKCCIRRDAFCDQCRFCCTLPMCTYKDNLTDYDSTPLAKEKKTAIEMFEAPSHIYVRYDYRCLKPNSHKDPNKWRHYDTEEFRTANDKSQLSKVYSYSFNKNMFNFFDQSILDKYTSKNGKRLLKRTYGFDYCSGINTIKSFPIIGGISTNCNLECEKAENGYFASNCRRKGGVFKCCQVWLTLHRFSEVNENLGLTKTTHCQKKKLYKYCDYCCITLMCTKKDKNTGKIFNLLKTKISRAQTVGGSPNVGYGFKMMVCLEMDMCNDMKTWLFYKSTSEYKNAYTPEEICRLQVDDKYETSPNISIPDVSDKKIKKCLKSGKSAKMNLKICSKKKLIKNGGTDKLIKHNKILAKIRKKRLHNCKERKRKKGKYEKRKCKKKKLYKSGRRKKKHSRRRSGNFYEYSIEDGYSPAILKI